MKPRSGDRSCRGRTGDTVPEHGRATKDETVRVLLALEAIDEALVAIYDRGLPASESERWHLFGMRDGLQLALTYHDIWEANGEFMLVGARAGQRRERSIRPTAALHSG
jgi:hypothetical protein